MPSLCNGATCCMNVPRLNRHISAKVVIDTCRNNLQIQIERVSMNIKLNDYSFGTSRTDSLYGVIKLK
ncbi:hypothetical protein KUTeg_002086 [Tegillarca granosa]|uniref:Uncharacterized protein n=1 Tax=Tegillarca granosa TaxID=220873 RepID=A0ABQ9FTB3_TEGGR|nr:hypothetical protein KUTeg_002086 [Tegillarca granosa]